MPHRSDNRINEQVLVVNVQPIAIDQRTHTANRLDQGGSLGGHYMAPGSDRLCSRDARRFIKPCWICPNTSEPHLRRQRLLVDQPTKTNASTDHPYGSEIQLARK